jgi:hypothetical protein
LAVSCVLRPTRAFAASDSAGPAYDALKSNSTRNHRHEPRRKIKASDKLPRRHVRVDTLEDLTPGEIEQHITRRIRLDGIAPWTANRLRKVLHVMFNGAIRQHNYRAHDLRFPNPVDAVPRRRVVDPDIRFLTVEQVDEQLEALTEHPSPSTGPVSSASPSSTDRRARSDSLRIRSHSVSGSRIRLLSSSSSTFALPPREPKLGAPI